MTNFPIIIECFRLKCECFCLDGAWSAGTLPVHVHLQNKQKKTHLISKIKQANAQLAGQPSSFFSFFDPGPSHSYHALSFIPCTRINMQKKNTTLHYSKPCRPAAESTAARQSPVGSARPRQPASHKKTTHEND